MSNDDNETKSRRPLDVLEASLGDEITVRLKSGGGFAGELGGYDQHLNVVLTAIDDESESTESVSDEAGVEAVEETLIIRGDNLVSIML